MRSREARPDLMRPIITLLTDFGERDYYVSAMKGVILSIAPDAQIVDITHHITPFSILEGAFVLWQAVRWFPRRTVHVLVVDPGVGSERDTIVVKAGGHLLVGPDNGALAPAAEALGIEEIRRIEEGGFTLPRSGTFDGRDVFAPVAAHLAAGVPLERIGPKKSDFIRLELFRYEVTPGFISGHVLHVDRFGNVVLDMPSRALPSDWPASLLVELEDGRRIEARLASHYEEGAPGELLVIRGSSGLLELSLRRGSAAEIVGLPPGRRIRLSPA